MSNRKIFWIILGALIAVLISFSVRYFNEFKAESFPVKTVVELGDSKVSIEMVAENFEIPWDLVWGPDNHIWLTERFGQVTRVNPVSGEKQLVLKLDTVYISDTENSGMNAIALHPLFNECPFVYLYYLSEANPNKIIGRVVRYRFNQEKLILQYPDTLITGIVGGRSHNGARFIHDSDSTMLLSIGESEIDELAQDMNHLSGKIIRMNLEGGIPADNPIKNSYIYTIGHRNPQGLVIGLNNQIYSSEHGPATYDELNIIKKGRNYGWPNVLGYCDTKEEKKDCKKLNVVEPILTFSPTQAPCGLEYYADGPIKAFQNSLLLVFLKEQKLMKIGLNEEGTEVTSTTDFLVESYGRLRDVLVGPEGEVYFITTNTVWPGGGGFYPDNNKIYKIEEFKK